MLVRSYKYSDFPDRQALGFEPPAGTKKNKVKDMEYYNDTLCISHAELTSGIMSIATLKKCQRDKRINQVRRGCRSTTALYSADSLPFKYKKEAYRRNPDLNADAKAKSFVDEIKIDGAAINYYETYTLEDGRHLSKDKITEYSNNACILNAFRGQVEDSDSEHRKH
ncbi:MAG: hypothetical protein RR513_09140, partial [Muribaculaceae bacterium]